MRHATFVLAFATTLAAACGGNETPPADTSNASRATPAATPPGSTASAATPPTSGKTWEVRMLGDDKGYRYDPASLTIKVGDAVHWTVVSGTPHNVTFWADSIPRGAAAALGPDMPNTMAPLTGPMLNNAGESYTVTFAGVPKGTYHYYCTPHLALGMKATLTVQ
jgi:plastocyanin